MNGYVALLGAALQVWNHHEANKYRDRYLRLKSSYDEEDNKPRGRRDNARLDELERELRDLGGAFIRTSATQPNAGA